MSQASDAPALPYPIPVPADAALEPPAEWAQLRQDRPIAPVVLPSGDSAALITRYPDVKQVLADPRCTRVLSADDAARLTDSESGGVFNSEVATTLTDAGHARWRRMLSRWFTAKRMTALRPSIEAMADQLIDEMVAHGAPADLSAHLGFPLPVWVICDMLGVPAQDRDRFAHWSNAFLNLTQFSQAETDSAQTAFMEYMAGHVATKRAQPTDDLLSDLITGTDAEGGRLSEMELLTTGQALLVAGHETTSGMIGKMVAMLLADRRRWEQLLANPSLVRPAVEEALRFDPNPGFGMPRYLREDIEIDSGTLARGTTVVCSMAAANRDATAFEAADEMDLTRSPNPHLTFGVGPHSCLGQSLARTELQAVLEVLLRRLPTLELAVHPNDLRRVEGLVVGRLQEVPVRW